MSATPFPTDALPDPARRLVEHGARSLQVSEAMLGPAVLTTMAGAIGNSRFVQVQPGWPEPAVLWSVVVAPSGTAKSPGLALATAPIDRRDGELQREHRRAWQAWKDRQHAKRRDPEPDPEPVPERLLTSDTTFEGLAAMLERSPRGMLLAAEELAAWLGGFARYSNSGRAAAEEARWLPLHGAGPLRLDRKTAPSIYVPHAALSIAGMVQPGVLSGALSATDFASGLVARILFSMPEIPRKRWRRGNGLPAGVEEEYARMVVALLDMPVRTDDAGDPIPQALTLDDGAEEVWAEYFDDLNAGMVDADERERASLSKLEGGAARMAVVVHVGRLQSGERVSPEQIDVESMERGVRLARWFRREAERVYAVLAESDEDREARELADWIDRKHGGVVTARDLTHGLRAFRGDPDGADRALRQLAEAGIGCWDVDQYHSRGGRPAHRFRLLHGVTVTATTENAGVRGGSGDGDGHGESR